MKTAPEPTLRDKTRFGFGALVMLMGLSLLLALGAAWLLAHRLEGLERSHAIVTSVGQIQADVQRLGRVLAPDAAEQLTAHIAQTERHIGAAHALQPGSIAPPLLGSLEALQREAQAWAALNPKRLQLEGQLGTLAQALVDSLGHLAPTGDKTLALAVAQMLTIQWEGLAWSSHNNEPLNNRLAAMKAHLSALQGALERSKDAAPTQRQAQQILPTARSYTEAMQAYWRHQHLGAQTQARLQVLATEIQRGFTEHAQQLQSGLRPLIYWVCAVLGLLFVASAFAAWVLSRKLTAYLAQPLNALAELTQTISRGDLGARADECGDDAMGDLARAFNRMLEHLQSSRTQLLRRNQELEESHAQTEQRVQERTRELAQTKKTLQSETLVRQHAQDRARASEHKFATLFELTPLGMARTTLVGEILECNKNLLDMLGYKLSALHMRPLASLSTQYAESTHLPDPGSAAEVQRLGSYEEELLHRDGQHVQVQIHAVLITGEDATQSVWIIVENITERKMAEGLIWQQANFDPLTGLPNRHMFKSRLVQAMRLADRQNHKLALLILDLDKFKEVNDTFGPSEGDALLREAAQRVARCVRTTDVVARLGGDEFSVILSALENTAPIETLARKILDTLGQPFPIGEESVFIGGSIGITLYPDDGTNPEELMRNADQAMYVAKEGGRNRWSYFTSALQESAQHRRRLISDLRESINQQQLALHFQPIVELKTGFIHKAEALIRWHHPERGLISPAEFVPLAEETNLIVAIGDWVFKEAARQTKRLQTVHYPEFQVSVNKSPIQFRTDLDYLESWFNYLREIDLSGKSIVIEITEGLLLDASENVKARLLEYRDFGIQVSLDDFGTGYSALAYLNRFDIDYIKIDQSFVRNLGPHSNDLALCEAIIVMAHKLGLKVIAEGVETDAQRLLLLAAGCDYAQGYFFSRPLPIEAFERYLAASRKPGKRASKRHGDDIHS